MDQETEMDMPMVLLTQVRSGTPVMINLAHVVALAENEDGTTWINLRHRRDILVSESLSEIFPAIEDRRQVQ